MDFSFGTAAWRKLFLPALTLLVIVSTSGCAEFLDAVMEDDNPGPPKYYDPYYNREKVWVAAPVVYVPQPEYYYESTSTKKKGNKVTKTTKIRNEFGDVVYENKKTTTKKKKK